MKRRTGFMLHAFLTLAILALCSGVASAVDGVILIDQNSFVGGQTFKITQPGSYRLSGNLTAGLLSPKLTSVIEINSDNVTLDLDGFNIDAFGLIAIQSHAKESYRNIEIRNGSVSNANVGIRLPYATHVTVKDLRISTLDRGDTNNPRYSAIEVGMYSIVHHNTTNGDILVECPGLVTDNVTSAARIEFTGRYVKPCMTSNNSVGASP
jgi:hypothetical protein